MHTSFHMYIVIREVRDLNNNVWTGYALFTHESVSVLSHFSDRKRKDTFSTTGMDSSCVVKLADAVKIRCVQ